MRRSIKDMLKGKLVFFVRYENKELIYRTECHFEFPVPISDTGTAVFKSHDKAMLYMRWVRKHIIKIEKLEDEVIQGVVLSREIRFTGDNEDELYDLCKHDIALITTQTVHLDDGQKASIGDWVVKPLGQRAYVRKLT